MNTTYFRGPLMLLMSTLLLSYNIFAQNTQLTTAEFEKGIAGDNVQILDVRTADEYRSGHIAHALQADWNTQDQFRSRAQHLDKTKTLFVYCASGGRSAAAAKWLRSNGFANVYELNGGFIKWKADNKPVEGMPDTKPMTQAEFTAAVSNGVILVDIGAAWCPPCRKMEQVLHWLQRDLAGKFKLVKVDASVNTDLMKQLQANEIPTFILYKNGKEVWRKQGVVELEELEMEIGKQ
jgi:rhodanese-related sulfurtransferase